MGQFSFLTQDTEESIWSTEGHQPKVVMFYKDIDGSVKLVNEFEYEGYGIFGGKDFYELVSLMNGGDNRSHGIDLCFNDHSAITEPNGTLFPQLYTFFNNLKPDHDLDFTIPPKNCPHQGWFPEEEDEYEEDEWDDEDSEGEC